MLSDLPQLDQHLLNGFQRDFPLLPRPFEIIARRCGSTEQEVLSRLHTMRSEGRIARVGATVRPNTAGASTLAAMQVPEDRLDAVATRVAAVPGVNHSYLREHERNLWFVLTAPDVAALERGLKEIEADTGIAVLDLRLLRPFNIDLGFSMTGMPHGMMSERDADLSVLRDSDRPLLHALSQGLALTPAPFAELGTMLGLSERAVIDRIAILQTAGILTRVGIIVRHRSLGWSANAMVVWTVPEARMIAAGRALAAHRGVTLCYQRRTVPGVWDHGLYSMIHARSRDEALATLAQAADLPELTDCVHETLFSVRCYKQTGAQISADRVA